MADHRSVETSGHDDRTISVVDARQVDADLVAAFAVLVPQLSRSSPPPGEAELAEMLGTAGTHLLLAVEGERAILGSLTLVHFRTPTGIRAWIEDVVVEESIRRRGVGEALVRRALDVAVEAGARTVDLTSRPSREAANRLYCRLGFQRRETNVYRWSSP